MSAPRREEADVTPDNSTHRPTSLPGRVAAVDYGTVRIGVAISDAMRMLASPFETYTRRGTEEDASYFQSLVTDESIALFVVGLPIHLDGQESQKSIEARQFGRWLAETTGVRGLLHDERYTSSEADAKMIDAGLTRKRKKSRRDMVAAQILLESFLESGKDEDDEPAALDDGV